MLNVPLWRQGPRGLCLRKPSLHILSDRRLVLSFVPTRPNRLGSYVIASRTAPRHKTKRPCAHAFITFPATRVILTAPFEMYAAPLPSLLSTSACASLRDGAVRPRCQHFPLTIPFLTASRSLNGMKVRASHYNQAQGMRERVSAR